MFTNLQTKEQYMTRSKSQKSHKDLWVFQKVDSSGNVFVTSFTTDDLETWKGKPLDMFVQFLRGCGYSADYEDVGCER